MLQPAAEYDVAADEISHWWILASCKAFIDLCLVVFLEKLVRSFIVLVPSRDSVDDGAKADCVGVFGRHPRLARADERTIW